MFTQLRIQNFKSWADTEEFRMAPNQKHQKAIA